jgi:hypothetical protein
VVVVDLLQLLEELPLVVPLLRKRKRRRRKRVYFICEKTSTRWRLTIFTEKEESDEDMGFGLFD